jgi:hypothetical protein
MIRALVLATLVSGCTIPIRLPDSKTCRADGAIGYIGQRYTTRIGRIVKDKTQATYVRTVTPGMMVTQEFRANRVNLALDDRNTVTRIYCG